MRVVLDEQQNEKWRCFMESYGQNRALFMVDHRREMENNLKNGR